MKLYTKEQLLKKYRGKYVDIYPHYDYMTRETTYEVRSVKNTIHENHNPPEEAITL
tara:strand:+ start:996 stop:1163 length:168 start_codon:yes stop_codon:yes gene_type:complete